MRALTFRAPGEIEVSQRPDPGIRQSTDAVVEVELAGICGSDLHPYEGREACRPGVIPGHEAVGVVVGRGSDVEGFEVGDRVIVPFTTSCGNCAPCRRGLTARCEHGQLFGWAHPSDRSLGLDGCQAEYVRVPHATGTLVSADGIPDRAALLLCDNLPTSSEALERARPADSLGVVGLGSVGLGVVALAVGRGIGAVVAFDRVDRRLELAVALGAMAGSDENLGSIAAVVEAAGTADAQSFAASLCRPGAVLSIISVQTSDRFGFDPTTAYDKNLSIAFGRASVRSTLDRHLPELASVAELLADRVIDTPPAPLSAGPELYRRAARREILKPTMVP